MRKNKSKDILNYFVNHSKRSIDVNEISQQFGVSTRQVKNYIRQLNNKISPNEIIIISKNECTLVANYKDYLNKFEQPEYTPKERNAYIISQLLTNNENINIFDIADTLYVSRPTIESDLKKIRKQIESFQLELHTKDDVLYITGREKNKRKLMSYMLVNTEYNGFSFKEDDPDVVYIRNEIMKIFDELNFVYTDYSINNIMMHLIITIDRLKHNYYIEELPPVFQTTHIEIDASNRICDLVEKVYSIQVSDMERNNFAVFLSCNLATVDYNVVDTNQIQNYVNPESISLVSYILDEIIDFYYLEPFDEIFFARFVLHVDNLLKRQRTHFSAHNPLANEIKQSYPIIYDIAVHIAQLFNKKTGYQINQDEISLIALHIGSFIENNNINKSKVTGLYVYEDYHGFYQHNISILQRKFGNELNLKYSISKSNYQKSNIEADIIISEVPLKGSIRVSPFISERQLLEIQDQIMAQEKSKDIQQFKESLATLFTEELFFTNIYGKDEFEVIQKLGEQILPYQLFNQDFIESVYQREKISSTCFTKRIAIPHAISQQVKKSFISIVCYEKNQPWGNESIQLVILIGISYPERKIFRSVFNHLVKLFENENNINAISKCKSYKEVTNTIISLL